MKLKKPISEAKKQLTVATLSFILTVLVSFSKAQIIPAVVPFETPDYGLNTGAVTSNCDTRKICGDILRVTVWDGSAPGLHWIHGADNGTIPLQNITAVEPDVSILLDAGGNCFFVFVVYAKVGMGTAEYVYETYKFVCPVPGIAPANLVYHTSGSIDPTLTNDIGIHVDADQSGNFAIAYSMGTISGTVTTNKVWTVIGTFDCSDGVVFCPTPYMVNPSGTPMRQTDPDVCIQKANNGTSAIKYSYLNLGHTLLCIQSEKHPGINLSPPCFEVAPPNSAVCMYSAQTSYKLYSPRIAAPKKHVSSSLGDDYTVVFLEKKVTGAQDRWYIRGYTWKWPWSCPLSLCNPPSVNCNGVVTYNDGNLITSPSYSPLNYPFHFYESEYPVVTYADENGCSGIIIGWNVKYGAPNTGGGNPAHWDPVAIQLNIDGQALSSPTGYHQVPFGPTIPSDQKAFSIAGRFSDDGSSSIQYSLYDPGTGTMRGKFTGTCPIALKEAVSINEEQNSQVSSLSVFPNPVSNKLNISLPDGIKGGNFVIYNILGTIIKEVAVNEGEKEMEIDTENLSSGSYFIQLRSKENRISGKGTFVKQ